MDEPRAASRSLQVVGVALGSVGVLNCIRPVTKCSPGAELPQLRTPGLESHLHEDKDCVNMLRGGLDIIYNGIVLIMLH